MDTKKTIRVLIAEDDFLVSKEIGRIVKSIGYEQVGTANNGEEAVRQTCLLQPDVVLMDIKMPQLSGLEAVSRIQDSCPTPVVILTAHESEELVNAAGQKGAGAYVTKPPGTEEIKRAVTIAMARHADLMQLRDLNKKLYEKNLALEDALAEIKTLRGILPICSHCKQIRDDQGYWHKIESYIQSHSEAAFSHGVCPDCIEKYYPDLYESD